VAVRKGAGRSSLINVRTFIDFEIEDHEIHLGQCSCSANTFAPIARLNWRVRLTEDGSSCCFRQQVVGQQSLSIPFDLRYRPQNLSRSAASANWSSVRCTYRFVVFRFSWPRICANDTRSFPLSSRNLCAIVCLKRCG
jgi:hypothetical protein